MLTNLAAPKVDLATFLLRLALAGIFIVQGVFKIVQDRPLLEEIPLFGGLYLTMTAQLVVGWTELVCGAALAVGLLSRLAALGLIPLQVGAIYFFTGKLALEGPEITAKGANFLRVGPEYNIFLILVCLAVILLGSGALSLDHFLGSLWSGKKEAGVAASAQKPAQPAHMR
jgi:uncharacterized membrane protein YphA (DoxX/SURF4 family)